ncbi:D-alanine--poly(phosphoribitol) ligase [Streptomyces tateyamensis]|uniref:D-alanine--poly(Phosphoribitol) ligase n=1 Tax=Streptomyces tateyamensis TaxID=565073 RepID=A0A2V4MT96_9ACTN|nr:AMP-binding protein [Streptomyces tateyamensis]PYC66974.1 D-alanine--poly(phosphoribitol) ligase [Streptomyces tateyamensis]
MNETPDPALYQRFLRGLARSPQRAAIRIGQTSVTYTEAHERALAWAGALLAARPEAPRVVGVLAAKGVTAYLGILAGLYTGATVVPLHPDFPAARTRRMLELSGVDVLVADEQGLASLAAGSMPEQAVPVLVPLGATAHPYPRIELDPALALAAPRPVESESTAYMLFTSGSTGRPKGVPISHGSTKHYFDLLDERYDFGPEDVFSQTFDLNFDCAMFDLFCAWGAGGTAHAVPVQAYRGLPAYVAEHGITVWFSTPSAIALIRQLGGLGEGALPGLRWSFFAGEALRCQDAADWQAAAPGSTLENIYGPTELTVTITAHRWDPDSSPELAVNGIVPIGAVHAGHQHLLLAEDGSTAEYEGELCITGPQMTRGYLDPADDAGRFLEHDGRLWYRTGDRVRRLPAEELAYLGRLDAQVQIQGWRVELPEVEHALRGCAGVRDAVTVTRPAEGGGVELVVFYTGEVTAPAALARQLRQILPAGMLPRDYRHLVEFPLNSNRKIDRGRLAAEAAGALVGAA